LRLAGARFGAVLLERVDAPLQGVQPPHPPLQLVDAVLELHPRVEEALRCRDVGELSDDVLAAVGELAQKILFALGHSSAFRPIANSIHRERTRVTT